MRDNEQYAASGEQWSATAADWYPCCSRHDECACSVEWAYSELTALVNA